MKFYAAWITVVAILAIALDPAASAKTKNRIISKRSVPSSTLSSFNNNIKNKINEYNSKITSLKNDMTSQLSSAKETIMSFWGDSDSDNGLEALDAAIEALASEI